MTVTVKIVGCPKVWSNEGEVEVFWQSRIRPDEFTASPDATWTIDVPEKDGKWTGNFVGRNSDGRRFLYFSWQNERGVRFRRIKLYQEQVTGDSVTIIGTMPDGSPACSTARIAT